MGVKEDLISSYLDDSGISRKWKGYRLLYEAIIIFMNDSSLDCNRICEAISTMDGYLNNAPRTIYTTSLYSIKRAKDSVTRSKSVYEFISDAAFDIRKTLVEKN